METVNQFTSCFGNELQRLIYCPSLKWVRPFVLAIDFQSFLLGTVEWDHVCFHAGTIKRHYCIAFAFEETFVYLKYLYAAFMLDFLLPRTPHNEGKNWDMVTRFFFLMTATHAWGTGQGNDVICPLHPSSCSSFCASKSLQWLSTNCACPWSLAASNQSQPADV